MTDHLAAVPPDPMPLPSIRPETLPTDPRGLRHPPIVKELAFVCWIEANGNGERARRLLVEEFRKDTTGLLPQAEREWPSANTLRNWARTEGWEDQLVQHVAGSYKHLLTVYTARLLRMGAQALDGLDELMQPEHVPTKGDLVRADLVKFITTILGLGTAGAKGGTPELASTARASDDPDRMSPDQRQQRHLARLEAFREQRRRS